MTRVNMYLVRVSVVLLLLGMATAAAQATAIAIANPGFDVDSLAGNPDGYVIGAPTGWTTFGIGAGYQLGNDGLAARSGENWGVLFQAREGLGGPGGLGQFLPIVEEAGKSITINAYQGHRTDYQGEGYTQAFQMQIWRDAIGTEGGGTLVGDSGDFGDVTPGVHSWTQRSYTYTVTNDDVGNKLYVLLYNSGPTQIQVEDVTASYTGTVIPEPSTLVLVLAGLIGLLAYAWRRRK